MLTGPALGAAIAEAIRLKGVSRSETARHFGVQPESTYDWTKFGRIAKNHLPKLFDYFADVVGPEHWGMPPSQPARLDLDRLAGLIETVEAAAEIAVQRVGLPASPRMKARLVVNLYAESGTKEPTARVVANALAKILRSEEATRHEPPSPR